MLVVVLSESLDSSKVVLTGIFLNCCGSYTNNFIFINSNSQSPSSIFCEYVEPVKGLIEAGWDIQIKI